MTGKTHAVGGLAAGLGVGTLAPSPAVALLCGAVGMVAAGVPDLDHPNGLLVRMLGPLGWLLCELVRGASVALCGVAHRGVTHSFACAALTGGVAGLVAQLAGLELGGAVAVGFAATAGVVAALLGDAITHAGLDWLLWPLPYRVRLPKWLAPKVGGPGEWLVVMPLSVALAVLAGWSVVAADWA